ncbi:HdeD family acid-resistance protein [Microbacterium sp. YY-01]|uniref:HdeD family acid-resistance protein n=1 Tax=Microbacterium sp. YY-01 TaxID=3421634 RepID=UPI003D17646C
MSEYTTIIRPLGRALRAVLAAMGIIMIAIGAAIMFWPEKTAFVVTALFAVQLLIAGVAYIAIGAAGRGYGGWVRAGHMILGLIYAAGAVLIFLNLRLATLTLIVFISVVIGIAWIIDGIVALTLVGHARARAWTIIYAIISIAGGVVLIFVPMTLAILFWMLGAVLVLLGVLHIIRAIRLKQSAQEMIVTETGSIPIIR